MFTVHFKKLINVSTKNIFMELAPAVGPGELDHEVFFFLFKSNFSC